MEIEAALPPPNIRLDSALRQYAFRIYKLPPEHPVSNISKRNPEDTPKPKEQPTQIERIQNSISPLLPQAETEIETLLHGRLQPWNRGIIYDIDISK